jgi:uncharacterized protein
MPIQIGHIYIFKVLRKSDLGYILTYENEELFLHNKETDPLMEDQEIEAFVYMDAYKRLAATTKLPKIRLEQSGFLEVVDRNASLGVFLDLGIHKHLLLSSDDLSYDTKLWPQVGDKVFVTLKAKNRLFAAIADIKIETPLLEIGTQYEGYVIKWLKEGVRIYVDQMGVVFVHLSQMTIPPRLGQFVKVKVVAQSIKGFSGTLLEQKEVKRVDDADIILEYLTEHQSMPLIASSSPIEIEHYFQMSKKAFKRALGHLYKLRKVRFDDTHTYLI